MKGEGECTYTLATNYGSKLPDGVATIHWFTSFTNFELNHTRGGPSCTYVSLTVRMYMYTTTRGTLVHKPMMN